MSCPNGRAKRCWVGLVVKMLLAMRISLLLLSSRKLYVVQLGLVAVVTAVVIIIVIGEGNSNSLYDSREPLNTSLPLARIL